VRCSLCGGSLPRKPAGVQRRQLQAAEAFQHCDERRSWSGERERPLRERRCWGTLPVPTGTDRDPF
jgi:hypothetical protein